jgi:thermitase
MKRLIFCLKENHNLDHLPLLDKMGLKMNRLHGIEDEMSLWYGRDDFKVLRNESLFNNVVYNRLDDSKRRLYRTYLMEFPNEESLKNTFSVLTESDLVEYAQLDGTNNLFYDPKDPRYVNNELWGLKTIACNNAWNISKGEDIVVAVVDTGIKFNHPDIAPNLWRDKNCNIGVFIYTDPDDSTKILFSQDKNDIRDSGWHGSHLSGSIAATMDTDDIVGVAPLSKIMTIKVSDIDNSIKDAIGAEGVRKAVYEGANVINLSWGRLEGRNKNTCLENAIDFAIEQGVIVVCAAGNANIDASQITPANYSKVICVGATNQKDTRWGGSNFGKPITIAAPGENIYSIKTSTKGTSPDSGTSMATAYVSGVVALMLAIKPLSPADIKSIIETNGYDLIKTDKGDWKRINAEKCVNAVKNLPQSNMLLQQHALSHSQRMAIDGLLKEHKSFLMSLLEKETNTNLKLAFVGLGIAKINAAICLNDKQGDIEEIIRLAILSHGYIPVSQDYDFNTNANPIERHVTGSNGNFWAISLQFMVHVLGNFLKKIMDSIGGREIFSQESFTNIRKAQAKAMQMAAIMRSYPIVEDLESFTIIKFGDYE